jgi:hypothetical protein
VLNTLRYVYLNFSIALFLVFSRQLVLFCNSNKQAYRQVIKPNVNIYRVLLSICYELLKTVLISFLLILAACFCVLMIGMCFHSLSNFVELI